MIYNLDRNENEPTKQNDKKGETIHICLCINLLIHCEKETAIQDGNQIDALSTLCEHFQSLEILS